MAQIDPARLQAFLNGQEAEIMLLWQMVGVLLDDHPRKAELLQRFQAEAQGYFRSAPPGTDPEYIVEARARLGFHLRALGGS